MTDSAVDTFFACLERSGLLAESQLTALRSEALPSAEAVGLKDFAASLVRRKLLTRWQAGMLLAGHSAFFLGKYKLLSELGRGGMGVVLKAEQVPLGRVVALKVMARHLVNDRQALARFHREIQTAAALAHPNVVRAIDADQVQDTHFLVMEYVEGEALDKILNRQGRLPPAVACEFVRQAAAGLQHAFEMGLAHRDIKPGNLLITYDANRCAQVKILDMGLACFTTAIGQQGEITATGQVLGTPDYIAPEQARDAKSADIRSDIYSLGCTLFRAISGRVPFEGQNVVAKLLARCVGEPPRLRQFLPEASPGLEEVVARMLARDPAARYQTPAEVSRALEPWCTGGAPAASLASPPQAMQAAALADRPVTPVDVISIEADSALNQFLDDLAHDDQFDRSIQKERSAVAAVARRRKWAVAAGVLLAGIALVALTVPWRAPRPATQAASRSPKQNADKSKMPAADRNDENAPADLQEDEQTAREHVLRLAEAKRLAEQEEERAKQREADAQPALAELAARSKEPSITFADLSRDVQAFRSRHGGTQAAIAASEILSKLVSPLDRLDPHDLPTDCLDHYRVLGSPPPPELVGILGDLRRKGRGWLEGFAGSPGGRFLVTGGTAIYLVDPRDGSLQKSLPERGFLLAMPADGKQLASITWPDTVIELWDLEAGRVDARLEGHSGQVWSLAFAPDGKTLLSAGSEHKIRIWDPATGTERRAYSAHVPWGAVCCVATSPDGKSAASLASEDQACVRSLASGDVLRTFPHAGVRAVAWSREGEMIATAGTDGSVRIWDAASGSERGSFQGLVRDADHLAFDPRGRILAVGQSHAERRGLPAEVRLFDVPSGKQRALLPHGDQVAGMAFSADGRRFFTTQWGSSAVQVWDVDTGKDLQPPAGHRGDVLAVAFSPIDCRIVTGGADQTMRVWDPVGGKEVSRIDSFRRGVASLAISPEGDFAVADESFTRWATDNGQEAGLRWCDLASGMVVRRFQGAPFGSHALAISADGKRVVSADSSISLWDTASGKVMREFDGFSGIIAVHCITFSPDGSRVVAAGDDGFIAMWEVESGREVRRFEGHTGAVLSVVFAPDGRRILSSGDDGNLRLWDVAPAEPPPLPTILANGEPCVCTISPNGKIAVAALAYGRIVLWDLSTGSKLREIDLVDHIRSIALAPDGRHLTTANHNGSISILRIPELVPGVATD